MTTATRLVGAAASTVFVAALMTVAARGPVRPPAGDVPLPAAAVPLPRDAEGPPAMSGDDAVPPGSPDPAPRPRDVAPAEEQPGDEPPDYGTGDDSGSVGWDEPDGRPGYSNGFNGCAQSRVPEDPDPPSDDLLVEVTPVQDAVRPRKQLVAVATLTNTGRRPLRVDLTEPKAMLLDTRGRPVSAVFFGDTIISVRYDLEPGETVGFDVAAYAFVCGDTSTDDVEPLPEGEYELVVRAHWSNWHDSGGDRGTMVSDSAPVTITADAEPPPCAAYSNGCVYSMGDRWYPGWCVPDDSTGPPYGASRGLTLRVVPDDDEVRQGEPVRARAVLRNDGARAFSLRLLAYGAGTIRSAGGALGDGPGLLGTGEGVSGGPSSVELPWRGRVLRLLPGESVSLPVVLETKECDGSPLPQGEYRLLADLYVAHHGWWQSPEERITLTA